jgi:zinc/manganese transport system permease protein
VAHIDAGMVEIVGPALAAGLMIALTHAPLGIEVLRRGIIFIDLAIAQIAGLGIVVATVLWQEPSAWITQVFALGFALAGAAFFRWVECRLPHLQEAIIGCTYVLCASAVLLLLADRPHAGEEIQHLLSGQILFVTWQQVAMHAPVYGTILLLWFAYPRTRQGLGFYLLFSAAITSSVQLTGVFVVFASLIAPALGASVAKEYRIALCKAYAVALPGLLCGFAIAIITDLPAGPVLVCTFILGALMGLKFFGESPRG